MQVSASLTPLPPPTSTTNLTCHNSISSFFSPTHVPLQLPCFHPPLLPLSRPKTEFCTLTQNSTPLQ